MQTKRVEFLEYLQSELNPNTYQVRMMEFGAELSEIYGELYELEINKKTKTMDRLNHLSDKSIENGDVFLKIVYPKEDPDDKFEYVQAMINLELNAGSKLTKYITAEPRDRVGKTKEALDRYTKLDKYIQQYYSWKKIKGVDEVESKQMRDQINIVTEMIELLPQKLDKMSAALR